MEYFGYEFLVWHFIGTDKKQVMETAAEYAETEKWSGIEAPKEEDIQKLEKICIRFVYPMAANSQFFNAEVRENVICRVNANAFSLVRRLAETYEQLRTGSLYGFAASSHLWFLPEYIMQGMREYNWQQHEAQVNEWLEVLNNTLARMEEKGSFARRETLQKKRRQPLIVFKKPIGQA